jgi:hypothetical protein
VPGQGAAVGEATGGAASPATDRGVAVGQWLGSAGEAPRLVAIDAVRAGSLLRGRLDGGRTWAGVGAALAPPAPVVGLDVPTGAVPTITGTASGPTPVVVTPRLLLQDATGLRAPCTADPMPLDGRPHRLTECALTGGLQLVAVSLSVVPDPSAPTGPDQGGPTVPGPGGPTVSDPGAPVGAGDGDVQVDAGLSQVAVTLTVPGAAAPAGSAWTATSASPVPEQLGNLTVALAGAPAGAQLRMTTTAQLFGPPDAALTFIATAFDAPGAVPVAVSTRLADRLGAHPGSQLSLTVDQTPIPVTVVDVLPTVPSVPGADAVLADLDTLSRALAVNGTLESPVDAWWVGQPTRADAVARVTALHVGTVSTRADETARLTSGPVRAALPAALRLVVPAAVGLLLLGVVLHVTCDLQIRALEVARLRGMGMSRGQIRAVLLGQHAAVVIPLVAAGAAVGAFTTRVVAPLLVRSDTGAAPNPAALPEWPWAAEGVLLAVLLAGCALAVTIVVTVQARRADAAHLRVAS